MGDPLDRVGPSASDSGRPDLDGHGFDSEGVLLGHQLGYAVSGCQDVSLAYQGSTACVLPLYLDRDQVWKLARTGQLVVRSQQALLILWWGQL